MKNILAGAAMLCLTVSLNAQSYKLAPQPPTYSFVNTPGITLPQIVDSMYANADVTDTEEGGEEDQLYTFKKYGGNR